MQNDKQIEILADIPGVSKDDVNVRFQHILLSKRGSAAQRLQHQSMRSASDGSVVLQLEVENGVLVMSVDRKEGKEEKTEEEGVTWHHTQRSHFFVKRSLRLPDTADMDNAVASYKDGVLTVTVPKTEQAVTKKRVAIS